MRPITLWGVCLYVDTNKDLLLMCKCMCEHILLCAWNNNKHTHNTTTTLNHLVFQWNESFIHDLINLSFNYLCCCCWSWTVSDILCNSKQSRSFSTENASRSNLICSTGKIKLKKNEKFISLLSLLLLLLLSLLPKKIQCQERTIFFIERLTLTFKWINSI